MRSVSKKIKQGVFGGLLASCISLCAPASHASSYRDSPGDALNPASDISDVYLFRSWADPNKIVLIMNVNGGQNPADGPLYFNFDDDVLYRINIDNDMDGVADDVVYEFQFKTKYSSTPELPKSPFPYVGNPGYPGLTGITSLDGPGSEGLRAKQFYSVTEIRGGHRKALFKDHELIAVPSNAGPHTMPNYEALAAQGIHADSSTGVKVFAGQRAEATYADIGAFYDGLNFRRNPPFLTENEDRNDFINPFGVNRFSGANVNSIVLEVPIARLTADRGDVSATRAPFIGMYASVLSRQKTSKDSSEWSHHRGYAQISRMANPTFNLLVNDIEIKDKYNRSRPEFDATFQDSVKFPAFANLLSSAVGLPVPPPPRVDLLQVLYKYPGQSVNPATGDCGAPCADLLHLNVKVPATPPELQSRLGALLSPDPSGLPNGRRPHDDVYDITLRAFGGPFYFAAHIGDGVNYANNTPGAGTADGPGYGSVAGNRLDVTPNGIVKEFPYLATPHAGR